MATSKYEGLKFKNGVPFEVLDSLTVEEGLSIGVNEKPLTVTMRTPGNDLELIHGLLFSEDIYTDVEVPLDVLLKGEGSKGGVTAVNVNIEPQKLGSGYLNSRSFLSVASCGICGKQELNPPSVKANVFPDFQLPANQFPTMFSSMKSGQNTFKESGGSHAAAAFNMDGNQLSLMEDVGRHNAVDKVIGDLILAKALKDAKCITVSGRISYEIVVKVFRARIPILAAVSAPSSLAVDYAKELGITLLAFCRDNKLTCYSHPQRLIKLPSNQYEIHQSKKNN